MLKPVNAAEINAKYLKVFNKLTSIKEIAIPDPISDDPVNTKLIVVKAGDGTLGYIREISTTTGCHSACLPILYRAFHGLDGSFLTLQSDEGLTKKNHAPFSPEDYLKLESLVVGQNEKFDKIKHPTEMTDALSGATLVNYQADVVREAAYTSLRVYLYAQQTKTFIKSLTK